MTPRILLTIMAATTLTSSGRAQGTPPSVELRLLEVSYKFVTDDTFVRDIRWTKNEGLESATLNDVDTFQFLQAAQGDQRTHVVVFPKTTIRDGQPTTVAPTPIPLTFFAGIVLRSRDQDGRIVDTELSSPAKAPKTYVPEASARMSAKASADGRRIAVKAEVQAGDKTFKFHADVPDKKTAAVILCKVVSKGQERALPTIWQRTPYVRRFVSLPAMIETENTSVLIAFVTPSIGAESEEPAVVRPVRDD